MRKTLVKLLIRRFPCDFDVGHEDESGPYFSCWTAKFVNLTLRLSSTVLGTTSGVRFVTNI